MNIFLHKHTQFYMYIYADNWRGSRNQLQSFINDNEIHFVEDTTQPLSSRNRL